MIRGTEILHASMTKSITHSDPWIPLLPPPGQHLYRLFPGDRRSLPCTFPRNSLRGVPGLAPCGYPELENPEKSLCSRGFGASGNRSTLLKKANVCTILHHQTLGVKLEFSEVEKLFT